MGQELAVRRGAAALDRSHRDKAGRFDAQAQALLRYFIDRAYFLADIAAEDQVAHQRAQLQRDAAAQLDGQKRDTAPVVQLVGIG